MTQVWVLFQPTRSIFPIQNNDNHRRYFQTMQDFWQNVSRYPRYFITFTLGVLYTLVEPLAPMMKRPITAIALIGFVIAAFTFLSFTLRAMLGLNAG
jgi:hypothetical protein